MEQQFTLMDQLQEKILTEYKKEESILNIKQIIGYCKYHIRKSPNVEQIDYEDILKVKYTKMLTTSLNVALNKFKHIINNKHDLQAIKEALEIQKSKRIKKAYYIYHQLTNSQQDVNDNESQDDNEVEDQNEDQCMEQE